MARETWNKEKIIEHINYMLQVSGLERMPTSSEVNEFYGDYKLSNAISKRRMWEPLAEELGLPVKKSETNMGKTFEKVATEDLIIHGYSVKQMSQNYPYDLLVEGVLKVDVKVSRLYYGKLGNFYSANIEKPFATCDLYIYYLVDDELNIKHTLIIPSKDVMMITQISVGEHKSKYYKYDNCWGYIENYIDAINNLSPIVGETL